MFNMTKRKKKGFSLLELLLVFGIIAALIVGVFMIYPKISSGQKIDSDIKILGTLNAGIKISTRGKQITPGYQLTL